MQFIRDLPLRRKLLFGLITTCLAGLAFACAALFWFQSVQFRKGFIAELESLASIIAHNSAAPLAFGDKKSAAEVLGALKVKPQITLARVLDSDGKLFARVGNGPALGDQRSGSNETGVTFDEGYALLSLPIFLDESRPGRLELTARFQDDYHRLLSLYAAVMASVLAGALVVILLMSSALQRIIVGPIVALADVAQRISDAKDYSARAKETGRDEVGLLTRTFNRMLDQIQSRDSRLRESQQRYEVAVMGSSDGLWDWDIIAQTVYFSPRWKSIIGFSDHELENSMDAFRQQLHPDDLQLVFDKVEDYLQGRSPSFDVEFRLRHKDGSFRWILSRGAALKDEQGKPFRLAGSHTDITAHKEAEKEMQQLNRKLRDASREAGMAEVATGVLHNVGNVLNSVNVSSNLIFEQVRRSKVSSLAKGVQMLRDNKSNLGEFLSSDTKGKQLPEFFEAISDHLTREQTSLVQEMKGLQQNIEHIKQIVAMQQSYAKVSGVLEDLPVHELVEDAVRMSSAALARHQITLVREFDKVPKVLVDRHKVLQILVNLVSNAKHALDSRAEGRKLTLRIAPGEGQAVRVEVSDNGMGITKENLRRLFNHGFTTKKDGHGFGLHSGAIAAKEMGGSLTVYSDGPGLGATFRLEFNTQRSSIQDIAPPADHSEDRMNRNAA
jgi:PAS domain S-box-containing protein